MCLLSEELADALLKSRGPLRTAFINHEGRRGSRWRPSRPNSEFLYWQIKPFRFSGAEWFSRRGGTCRLHATYEPTVY
jgi:hypothetical protein